jgi:Family of unknown function (DUF6325)
MAESLGPVQYIVVGFPGNKFKGEIIPELGNLVKAGLVRVMDLAFVQKTEDGSIVTLELEDLNDDEGAPFASFEKQIGDLLNQDDLVIAAEALETNSSAAVLVWENLWARKFADALRAAGGVLVAYDRIPYEVIEAAMAVAAKPAD